MGHSDIRLTMDIYASLFEEDRDDHGSRLSDAAEEAFSKKCSQNVRILPKNKPETWSRLGDSNSGPTHYESVQTLTDEVRAWGYVREVVSSRRI